MFRSVMTGETIIELFLGMPYRARSSRQHCRHRPDPIVSFFPHSIYRILMIGIRKERGLYQGMANM